eukprot:1334677-Pyramimonas_sp.AAC.1
MCSEGLYGETHWPAPKCLERSVDLQGDIYYFRKDPPALQPTSRKLHDERHKMTVRLVKWAARAARSRYLQQNNKKDPLAPCEERIWSNHQLPAMFPEEFEMIVKTMARAKPRTYLEWGSGVSTAFFPLLASGQVRVIDNNPPWCARVQSNQAVQCMQQQRRL